MTGDKSTEIHYLFKRKSRYSEQISRSHSRNNLDKASSRNNDLGYPDVHDHLIKKYVNKNDNPEWFNKRNSLYLYIHKKKKNSSKTQREYNIYQYSKNEIKNIASSRRKSKLKKQHSLLEISTKALNNYNTKKVKSSEFIRKSKCDPYSKSYIVNNCCRTCDKPQCNNPFQNPKIISKVYRCQMENDGAACCCSCNSDAMFEVMKSLYDCYKNKNCANCKCILCGFGKQTISTGVGEEEAVQKKEKVPKIPSAKLAKAKAEGFLTPLQGKAPEEKERILRGLARNGVPLPEGKTDSEKKIISKVREEMGLPPEPKNDKEKERMKKAYAKGIITPLEGKTPEQKEAALRRLAEAGVPLPKGRTPSEKALIDKVKGAVGVRKPSGVPSEKFRKAKAEGFMTPLQGKSPEIKEKILRGHATYGIPLPEGTTSSEKKLIDKVRKEMGLPPEPKTASEKKRLQKAYEDGVITPLEGKTPSQKEAALRKIAKAGVPLPEGRTPSEKAMIEKVKAEVSRPPAKSLADKLETAKAEGLITPLENKTPEQKEKILRGLAMQGIPLPEGKTLSEKKLIDKVRKDMGLPPEPKTSSEKKRLQKAYEDGVITPLEGKTPSQKEAALRKIAKAGVPLPEGRTPSEKALIDKVKAEVGRPPAKSLADKLKTAKAEGLITPLENKTPEQKEKILRGLAMQGIPLPEGKTLSEKKLIDKVRQDMGLPPEPKNSGEKKKLEKAYADGIVTPLEGKTPQQKENALRKMAKAGIQLPEGRTPSEKALIDKVRAEVGERKPSGIPSEKLRKAKAEGFITPLEGKTPEQKQKILRGLAANGIPLPEGKTPSEKNLIDKVRKEMGLPAEPKTSEEKKRLRKAYADGIITPLEGKTAEQKEVALRKMAQAGVPLPEGRTPSEKALVDKVKAETGDRKPSRVSSEKFAKAKAEGIITPLDGKTPEQKEKILRGLATHGIPLPEGKTPSEKKLIDKVRKEMGLPPEPKTSGEKKRLQKAYADGIITPLEGKSPEQKEAALRKMVQAGIPLPEGRTPSEKALINKVKTEVGERKPSGVPSEKIKKAKAEGFITPLEGKTPEQKQKILKGLARNGIPLPEGKTPSEKLLIEKVRQEMGLPPEPKSSAEKKRYKQAYANGIITPLEGKTPEQKEAVLRKMAAAGIPLPDGRTSSEKAMIAKVKELPRTVSTPPEKLLKAKEAGLVTPLAGKTPDQKEKILKGLAKNGMPLPEGISPSEKALIDKVRKEMGLPPSPTTSAGKAKMKSAYAKGLITPLEGKTPDQKENAIRRMIDAGVPLPEGRTPSEQALINKVRAEHIKKAPSEKLRQAKAAGLLTPLEGKTPQQKEKILKGLVNLGLPLPEGKTDSEKKLIDKVRHDMGLPPEAKTPSEKVRMAKFYAKGLITPLEGKSPEQKEVALRRMAEAGIPLPEGRTPSEKAIIDKIKADKEIKPSPAGITSEKLKKAKTAGLLTPLEGKTPEEKEKILRGLAKLGIPLPEGKTPTEKKLINKVRKDLGLPPEAKTPSEKVKYAKSYAKGIITPLEGKTPEEKEKVLRRYAEVGLPLPEGKTSTEKALIAKIKGEMPSAAAETPSVKFKKAKKEGLITPLEGKTPEQKEKILRGFATHGIPLPEGKTPSEIKLIDKVRKEMGLPPEPKTSGEKKRLQKGYADGIITPLEGKTPEKKEAALRKMAQAGISLPEGRTPSEKALVEKVKAEAEKRRPSGVPSEKLRKAKAGGFITPLEGKTPEQKEKILRGLAANGIPLPEGKTESEKKLIDKVRQEMGLPVEPKTSGERKRLQKAYANGIVTPLEGKTPVQKEAALRKLAQAGVPLPKGRTPSEIALIDKIKAELGERRPSGVPSEKLRKAKAEGFITPLEGKTPEQKEKILKGLATNGIPLPEGKTASEKKLIDKVRQEMGLPVEPKTSGEKKRLRKAYADGIITPLEGKTLAQKEAALRKMAQAGVPLPEGRTPSEKALIDKVKAEVGEKKQPGIPSEKLREAKKAEGLITPLEGKTPEQKKKILQRLAANGIPFPEGKTPSERRIMDEVRKEMGLPPLPKTASDKALMDKAYADGIITPLEGKSAEAKEKALRKMANAGIPLPEGRTDSEKAMIEKIKAETPRISEVKRKFKEKGIATKPVGFDAQEMEEIQKTTKCDRACGCDRKKIRFKHSYVKIRVTSPDISSFCDCPDECIPGVKGGVFVDNEGIKVTIGFSSITSHFQNANDGALSLINQNIVAPDQNFNSFCTSAFGNDCWIEPKLYNVDFRENNTNYEGNFHIATSAENIKSKEETSSTENDWSENNTSFYTVSSNSTTDTIFSHDFVTEYDSYDSVMLVKTESSLNISTGSLATELATISIISFDASISSFVLNDYTYKHDDAKAELRRSVSSISTEISVLDYEEENISFYKNEDVTILRFAKFKKKNKDKNRVSSDSNEDNIMKIVAEEILNKTHKSDSSSIFVVLHSDDDTKSDVSSTPTHSKRKSNPKIKLRESYPIVSSEHQLLLASRGMKLTTVPREIRGNEIDRKSKTKNNKNVVKPLLSHYTAGEKKMYHSESTTKKSINLKKESAITSIKIKCDQETESVNDPENAVENMSYSARNQNSEYHKTKTVEKQDKKKSTFFSSNKKKHSLEFDRKGIQSRDRLRDTNTTKRDHLTNVKPISLHQIVETTNSLTITFHKSTEVEPQYELKHFETICEKPCHCDKKLTSQAPPVQGKSCCCENRSNNRFIPSSVTSKISDKELSPDKFVHNSIPFLYQAHRFVSRNASPSDSEPCKCHPKQCQLNHKVTKEYSRASSELWVDYGKYKSPVSKHASVSDLLPCRCEPKKMKSETRYQYKSEISNDEQSHNTKYYEQKMYLKHIQDTLLKLKMKNRENLSQQESMGIASITSHPLPKSMMDYDIPNPLNNANTNHENNYAYRNQSSNDVYTNNTIRYTEDTKTYFNLPTATDLKTPNEIEKVSSDNYETRTEICPHCNQVHTTFRNISVGYDTEKPNEIHNDTNVSSNWPDNTEIHSQFMVTTENYEVPTSKTVNCTNYSTKCPDCMRIINPGRFVEENQLISYENSIHQYPRSHQSQTLVTCIQKETPRAPPPTRLHTNDQNYQKKQCCKEPQLITIKPAPKCANRLAEQNNPIKVVQQPKMCNTCCKRGRIRDCFSPGQYCDPCDRTTQPLPSGFKLSNAEHSRLHLRDLMSYEDSSQCCCKKANQNKTKMNKDICKGDTVEDIRDAAKRFIEARDQGIVCNIKSEHNKNKCEVTRELFQGIEDAIREHENNSSGSDICKCSKPIPNNTCWHCTDNEKRDDNCACSKNTRGYHDTEKCDDNSAFSNNTHRVPENVKSIDNCVCSKSMREHTKLQSCPGEVLNFNPIQRGGTPKICDGLQPNTQPDECIGNCHDKRDNRPFPQQKGHNYCSGIPRRPARQGECLNFNPTQRGDFSGFTKICDGLQTNTQPYECIGNCPNDNQLNRQKGCAGFHRGHNRQPTIAAAPLIDKGHEQKLTRKATPIINTDKPQINEPKKTADKRHEHHTSNKPADKGQNNQPNKVVNKGYEHHATKKQALIDIRHLGLRELSQRQGQEDQPCSCRIPTHKSIPPREECICPPADNCACPAPTDEDWVDFFEYCFGKNMKKRECIKLQTELAHTTSGFKVMKKRKICPEEISTFEDAIEYYSKHEGFDVTDEKMTDASNEKSFKPNADNKCPGCGTLNCPGLWQPSNPTNIDPEGQVIVGQHYVRHAREDENEASCSFTKCEDVKCPGMGPYGKLPPIPGGPVSDVKVIHPAERGPHKACVCEPIDVFESETYCSPKGPVFCECAKGSNVTCECHEGEEGEKGDQDTGEKKDVKFDAEEAIVIETLEGTEGNVNVKTNWTGPCGPFGGFKVSLGAKGAESTGLKGICCFNALEKYSDTSIKSATSENSIYVIYY